MEFILVENIDIVMRQTNYTKEEAEQIKVKLEEAGATVEIK